VFFLSPPSRAILRILIAQMLDSGVSIIYFPVQTILPISYLADFSSPPLLSLRISIDFFIDFLLFCLQ